jgi:hypothetical protein
LTAGLAVAAAAVAAELREDGDDLIREVDGDLPRAAFDAEGELGGNSRGAGNTMPVASMSTIPAGWAE